MPDPFKSYLQALQSALAAKDATEHTHRPALKALLESPALDQLIARFPVAGSQVVERVHYDEKNQRGYINPDQYFEGVPPDAWAFQVGGYQVLHKWLKDRKGRQLSFDDLHHYQKVVVALAQTIRLMAAIDAAIDAHGGWPLK